MATRHVRSKMVGCDGERRCDVDIVSNGCLEMAIKLYKIGRRILETFFACRPVQASKLSISLKEEKEEGEKT